MARDSVPRYVIVQDPQLGSESVIRVRDTAASAANFEPFERGPVVSQPEPGTDAGAGNLRPTLSGSPEFESGGSLRVIQPGVEGSMRWGHVVDGASDTTDLQLRQKPCVVAKRVDLIERTTTGARDRQTRPKLLPLNNGSLLMLYLSTSVKIYDADVAVGWTTSVMLTTYSPSTDLWLLPTTKSELGDFTIFTGSDQGPFWVGIDMVQIPDTDEIIAVMWGTIDEVPGGVAKVLLTYSSKDNGQTWAEKARNLESGNDPDLVWDASDVGQANGVALERTEGGRLVCTLASKSTLHFATSDDRGKTWQTGDLPSGDLGISHGLDIPSISCSLTRLRNGVILAGFGVCDGGDLGGANVETHDEIFYLTTDGLNWSNPFRSNTNNRWGAAEVAVVETPDGWPWIYASTHELGATGDVYFDELTQAPFAIRDPLLSQATQPELFPTSSPQHVQHFHLLVDAGRDGANRNNAPAGDLDSGAVTIDGFYGLDVVRYRDGLWMAVVVENEPLVTSSLMVYRLAGWQPIQERHHPNISDQFTVGITDRPLCAAFNLTWDCYDHPDNWGFALTGAGAVSLVPITDGGYLETTVAAAQRFYTDSTLPYDGDSRNGLMRSVFRVVDGGSTTQDDIAIKLRLADTGIGMGIHLFFALNGSDVDLDIYDAVTSGLLASVTITDGALNGKAWIEVLLALRQNGDVGQVFTRVFQSLNGVDRDYLTGYTQQFSGALTIGSVIDSWQFGHFGANVTATAHWKSMHLNRHPENSIPEAWLIQRGTTYVDSDFDNYRNDRAEPFRLQDPGVYNHMRGAQAVAIPEQHVEHGLFASWRGEAQVPGSYDYSTDHIYAGKHLFDLSTMQREWRGTTTGAPDVEIVLDAEQEGGVGAVFRPEAIAVFGRNFPVLRLQFNAADTWGAPTIDFRLGIPGIAGAPAFNRLTHIFHVNTQGGWSVTTGPYRVLVTAPNANIFRDHRFQSRDGGPRFYAVFPNQPGSGLHSVFEILDNTQEGLHLTGDPVALGISTNPNDLVIMSDRFAYDFAHLLSGSFVSGWRYMRLVVEAFIVGGPDQFQRAGVICIGKKTLIDPGIAWGMTGGHRPGSAIVESQTGARYSVRNHSPRKTWSLDSPFLRPPSKADATLNSPAEQRASWAKLVDLMRRLEANGEPAALVYDGLRFEGDPSERLVQVAADPFDLAMVRATSMGTEAMGGYMGRTMNLPLQDDCAPQEIRAVRRIVLEEDL